MFGLSVPELEAPVSEVLGALICRNDEVVDRVCDPERCRMQLAVAISRLASSADATFEARVARRIGVCARDRGAWSYRALDLLGSLSTGARVLPYLVHLVSDQDRFIRSRAALLAGRAKRDVHWMRSLLNDPDPRVRANAVESLWGMRAEAEFAAARRDYHHRVSANAVVGLHITGGGNASGQIGDLLAHRDPLFQAAGAWAAGRCQEGAVANHLRRLARTPGGPRGAALRALVELRRSAIPLDRETVLDEIPRRSMR